ncbi:hypothetical protein [Ruminococcus flavefaciens]|uniref:hypothetical protein n=1 Tax=Ruminococcus flavefaciens TaxID=1265 RepID=UPI001FA7BD1F|nr:hypothetical protein [Ruminococcus flavefaciens]
MKKLLNSLYILDETAWLTLDGENIVCKCDDSEKFRLPFSNLEDITVSAIWGVLLHLWGNVLILA